MTIPWIDTSWCIICRRHPCHQADIARKELCKLEACHMSEARWERGNAMHQGKCTGIHARSCEQRNDRYSLQPSMATLDMRHDKAFKCALVSHQCVVIYQLVDTGVTPQMPGAGRFQAYKHATTGRLAICSGATWFEHIVVSLQDATGKYLNNWWHLNLKCSWNLVIICEEPWFARTTLLKKGWWSGSVMHFSTWGIEELETEKAEQKLSCQHQIWLGWTRSIYNQFGVNGYTLLISILLYLYFILYSLLSIDMYRSSSHRLIHHIAISSPYYESAPMWSCQPMSRKIGGKHRRSRKSWSIWRTGEGHGVASPYMAYFMAYHPLWCPTSIQKEAVWNTAGQSEQCRTMTETSRVRHHIWFLCDADSHMRRLCRPRTAGGFIME